ncbi:serine/threonine protein kinase [Cetobacterium sp. 8H]|uniref:serine/threonine protein kinase n=1 Tax=Cetobacterium sp. 8H TaxID=2759681 RepID=UPI00163C52C3|nr:serine/threonine protein kinase [Cetobacterium sp. 8H]MBC2851658.1 serine/threonine protein kinase [Cetobacterium sp. 8H]
MRRYLNFIFIFLLSVSLYAEYDFPMKNPYVATIIGSSKIMTEGIPENVPTKEYKIELERSKKIPENLWYEKGFKFSLSKQKGNAPLIYILSGTGSAYNSVRTKNFQRIFYKAGYHVLTVTSVFNSNFVLNVSNSQVPGVLIQDGLDLYNVMKDMLDKVKKEDRLQIDNIYLMGYSMGATHSAVLSYLDSVGKDFNFKRVYMVNPSINLYYSAKVLDDMLDKNIENKAEIGKVVNEVIDEVKKNISPTDLEITEESIYSIFEKHELSDKKMKTLIGLAFNLTSIDLNYIVDQINGTHVYSKKTPGKFTSMYPYFEAINFADFSDYLEKLAYPYYLKILGGDLTFNDMIKYGNLRIIGDYLKNEKKIVVVTNEDDFILSTKDKKFIKETFKERSLIYPYGGHCGNMFYQTNVDKMLEYLNKGVFNNEL